MDSLTVTFFASFLIWFLFFGLLILWFVDGNIKKEQVVHALFAVLVTWLVAFLIKESFPTLRPFLENGGDVGVILTPHDSAFPSQHTATAFAIAITIYMHDKKVGGIYLISALLIGIARVMANVHYPIDILGGALLGSLIALFVERTHLFKVLEK